VCAFFFQTFDLILGGISFFKINKIFEPENFINIGLKKAYQAKSMIWDKCRKMVTV